ncbi:MAG TPA: cytochrome c biogenesis protein DipZ [Acidimicrobiales bacterium]|nr:cytochrome c biogenesis protein DipZ [Acidimicrobiales bacterium]
MILLYLIGFVGGLVVGISPCILPVLPVILVAGATTPVGERATGSDGSSPSGTATATATATVAPPATVTRTAGRRNRRSYAVIAGIVLSFSVITLVGSAVLSALGLPQDLLRDAGLVILGAVAVGLMVPALGEILERPFARFGRHQPTGSSSGFVLGLGLGVLFTPCAGPILSAITTVGATHRVGFTSVVLTVVFACGAAVPLLAFALAGERLGVRLRAHAVVVRQVGGVVLAVMTLVLAFNWADGLQTAVPGYTSALQRTLEGSSYAKKQLEALEGTGGGSVAHCTPETTLVRCGRAPAFTGITRWLNTPGGRPLTLASLRGKVVLVDFWTYSCINCQRSLPHVEAWYSRYHADGLDVIGVHTPEFAFEHVVSNVAAAARQLGVRYPIAVDDGYKTWDAYSNMYWPAEYLVDATGQVRHVEFGEGDYGATESLIRQLLVAADPKVHLPPPTGVPDRTPVDQLTPESYLGYNYQLPNLANASITPDRPATYTFPASIPLDDFALAGTWTSGAEDLTAGAGAKIELSFMADDVYLVLGGSGTLDVSVNGRHTETITVGGTPRLYTLVHGPYQTATVTLGASPGVQAYDFTFG